MEGMNLKKYMLTTRKRFDPTALIISVIGLGSVVFAIAAKESLESYLDLRSILVVVVGTFASLLFQFDFGASLHSLKLVLQSFLGTPERKIVSTVQILDAAIVDDLRLNDLREGEEISGELLNDIVYMHKQGLLFEEIDEFVSSRISDEYLGRKVAVDYLRRAAIIAPALGLFGTVIGLIGVLKSLSDPSQIGPSMSLALMTTAYGAGMGSIIFTPLAGRLEHHNTIYVEIHQQILAKINILLKRDERNPGTEFEPRGAQE